MHALDPSWRPDVITGESDPSMVWGRWRDLRSYEVHWPVERIDSTGLTVEEIARAVRQAFGL